MLVLLFLFGNTYADEIQRIESIVNDIENLRQKYENSQEELISKEENIIELNKKIFKLENQIILYSKQVKTKEKTFKKQKTKEIVKICKPVKVKPKIIYKIKKLENPNKFPVLMLKPEYVKYTKKNMQAKTYRFKYSAYVYDSINGEIIATWKKGTAFTSNEKAVAKKQDSWMRVTGYFIKKTWVPSKRKMWIKSKYIK